MRKPSKKGFTIVELVIVIAVVAILAAVLIPTFVSVTKKANESKDTQLVRNLNTALATDVGVEHETMQSALDAAAAAGYDVAKINASATGNEILWDSVNDVFCYRKGDAKPSYVPETTLRVNDVKDYQYWIIASEPNDTYSTYLYGGKDGSVAQAFDNVKNGIDVGNEHVTSITYIGNGSKQDVVIRTNGGTLNVKAQLANVDFYGYAQETIIDEVASDSFNVVDGIISYAEINKGHLVVKNNGIINVLYATSADVKIDKEGSAIVGCAYKTVENVAGNIKAELDEKGANKEVNKSSSVFRGEGTESSPYLISNANEFSVMRDKINAAVDGDKILSANFKFTNDVDLSAVASWVPLGTSNRKFSGTFDGNDKNISNMKIENGSFIGLFGYVDNATIKNIKLVNANVRGEQRVGALIGQISGKTTIQNCSTDSKTIVSGNGSNTAGLIGEAINGSEIKLIALTNNATVENGETSNSRAAGIICQVTNGAAVTIKDCINNGVIKTNNGYAGGIVSAYQNGSLTIDGCKNTKNLSEFTGKAKADLLAWMTSVQLLNIQNYDGELVNALGIFKDQYKRCITFNGTTILVNALSGGEEKTFAEIYEDRGTLDKTTMDRLVSFYEYVEKNLPNWNIHRTSYWGIFSASGGFGDDGWPQALAEYNKATFENENDYLKKEEFDINFGEKLLYIVE